MLAPVIINREFLYSLNLTYKYCSTPGLGSRLTPTDLFSNSNNSRLSMSEKL